MKNRNQSQAEAVQLVMCVWGILAILVIAHGCGMFER